MTDDQAATVAFLFGLASRRRKLTRAESNEKIYIYLYIYIYIYVYMYIYIYRLASSNSSNQTRLAIENPLEMEVFIGNSLAHGSFSSQPWLITGG